VRDSAAFEEDCRKVDIIVSALIAPPDCRARQVFDGARLARDGAVALYFSAPAASAASRSALAQAPSAWQSPSGTGDALAVAVVPSYGVRRPWTPK
jgi:competence protein ComEC